MSSCTFLFFLTSLMSNPAGSQDPGMIIVTTENIRTRSVMLARFVEEKEKRGFRVHLATEADFGGEGSTGLDKGLLIRQYLQAIHSDYTFLLLIGDSHSIYGEVPMFVVWPRHELSPTNCHGFALDCRSCETDYMYADLTGNWDLNENGRYGETGLDEGPGGIDFEPELIVGRIPTYFDDVRELDQVLQNAIGYMNQTADATGYRNRVLLPASFYYFQGQQLVNLTAHENVDGADTAEWFVHNVVDRHAGFTVTRMYEQEGHVVSAHDSDIPLTEENLVEEWSRGYGMVFWFGHGLDREVARTIWVEDANSNDIAESNEMQSVTMIHSDDAEHLGGSNPAFVVGVSCEIGSAETPYNLSYSLLLHGGGVGVIGSNSVTPGSGTDWADPDAELDTTTTGGDSVGIRFFDRLMEGESAGQAFYDAKVELGDLGEPEPLAGKMMLNYFGDPSLTLNNSIADIVETVDPTEPPADNGSGGGCAYTGTSGRSGGWALFALLILAGLGIRRRRR